MKKFLGLAILAILAFGGGCAAPNKAFVGGVDALWKVIGPEYEAYVSSDPVLTQDEKDVRLSSATSMDKLIREAQK